MKHSYSEFVQVTPRFARSVNLERDINSDGAVDGYVLTETALNILIRMVGTFSGAGRHRAWTLTGPYGSGKSAFALYCATLLGRQNHPASTLARDLLKARSPELVRSLFDRRKSGAISTQGFCAVTLTGSAEPLSHTILRCVVRDVVCSFPTLRSAPLKDLQALESRRERGKQISADAVVKGVRDLAVSLQRSGKAQGLFIIIDELGKFLEFAARNPELGDVFTLQLLAEATASHESPALLLFTILHQSFDRYVATLRPSMREEWAKIQGRFDDIAFQESPEEFLVLISHAISQRKSPLATKLREQIRPVAESVIDMRLVRPVMSRTQLINVFQRCAPLHPVAVLALARLCRKFGQNQRSLFSFLVSREPSGFLYFLEGSFDSDEMPLYTADALYDYAADCLGSGLSVGEAAGRWAEVQSTLDRAISSSAEEIRVLKSIGLLNAIGTYGELKPSPDVLRLALSDDVDGVTRKLVTRSLLVFRKHSNSFSFWQGSDIDLDVCLAQARRRVADSKSVSERLQMLWPPRPIVAKRHSIESGTLRYFGAVFADARDLAQSVEKSYEGDGVVLYLIPESESDRANAVDLIRTSPVIRERSDVVIAIPQSIDAVAEVLRELELLTWVQNNTPELQGDAVGRKELRSRIATAEQQLRAELDLVFSPSTSVSNTRWYHRGMPVDGSTPEALAKLLSKVCDQVYFDAPVIHNELLNRALLSSAAAAARRNLIEAMMSRGNQPTLGFEGTPPEVSMYESLLHSTGIHRHDGSGWSFGAPLEGSTLQPAWKAIEQFFETCELHRRPVVELFTLLQRQPFGMKMGVIPVLFCAAVLAHDTEVALYESGAFLPDTGIEVFERLLRNTEKFELRRYCIEGVRREVFNQFAFLLESPGSVPAEKETLIEVVRPLFRFFNRLPSYSRQTKSISQAAMAIREALFAAREPDVLLFQELPVACGFPPFSRTEDPTVDVGAFFTVLKRGLLELQRAYDELLGTSQQMLFRAFGVTGPKGREVLRFRARTAFEHAIEPRLKAFLMHLMDEELEDVPWVEAIATLLASKPPKNWNDGDRARFEVTLGELVRNFRHIESLVTELTKRGSAEGIGEVIRIGVTDRNSRDLEAVVIVESHNCDVLADVTTRLEQSLESVGAEENPSLALAALGIVSRKFISALESTTKPAKVSESKRGS